MAAPRYEFPATFLISAGLLLLVAWLLAHTVLRDAVANPELLAQLLNTLIPDIRPVVNPEPRERWLFILLALASPGCVLVGSYAARLFRGAPGLWSIGCFALLAGGVSIYMLHGKSLFLFFVYPASPLLDLALLYAAGALLFMIAWRRGPQFAGSMGTGRADRVQLAAVAVIACLVVMLPRGLGIRSVLDTRDMSPFGWEDHFQAVAYPLSQIFAGKPLLTAAPPLYGYNAEFLLPLFKIIGLSVFKFCLVMGLIQLVALTAVLAIASGNIRTHAIRILCCAALLYFIGSTCLVGRRPFDPVFQYWPVRFVFPALSVPLYLWAVRRDKPASWICLGVFTGLALMWNLDSGIALAGAILFALALECIAKWRGLVANPGKRGMIPLLTVAGSAFVTGGLFWLFLEIQAGWKPPFRATWEYQRLFYECGFAMLPMPLGPHPWWLVAATYLGGLAFGMKAFLAGNRNTFARLSVFLSVLGIGLFTYYQGRSVDFNLMNAAWPAILLAFMFADRLLRAIRARLLPRGMCWLALPAAYLGMMAVIMFPVTLWNIGRFGLEHWRLALGTPPVDRGGAMEKRVAFIRAHVGKDSECAILADYQAVYYVETGFRSPLDAPGLTEIFFLQDLERLRSALITNLPRHLFADETTLARLELTETVQELFQQKSTSSDGKLVYFEPR